MILSRAEGADPDKCYVTRACVRPRQPHPLTTTKKDPRQVFRPGLHGRERVVPRRRYAELMRAAIATCIVAVEVGLRGLTPPNCGRRPDLDHCDAVRTPVTKYWVSPKQCVGTPRCCSYVISTRCPMDFVISAAIESLRTEKSKISGWVPGRLAIAISPSQVLHNHPFFENF